jgi:hypothetical protein
MRVTAIRIDVHPAGENMINVICTLPMPVHVHLTYAFCGQFTYMATIHVVINSVGRILLLLRISAPGATPSPTE